MAKYCLNRSSVGGVVMKNWVRKWFHIRPCLWGVLSAAGVVGCAATFMGFLGKYSWFLDLFSHFRVQYMVCLVALGVLFGLARRHRMALFCVVFAGINAGVVFPLYVGGSAVVAPCEPSVRVLCLNVNTERGNPDRVKRVIEDATPDIVVLEEINLQWVFDLLWLSETHPYSCIQPRSDNFGIGLFSKVPIAKQNIINIGRAQVPSIIATLELPFTNLTVVATHPLPPWGRDYSALRNDQLDGLLGYIESDVPLILVGDLNMTPWSYHFKRLLKQSGLMDSTKGFGVQPSWSSFNPLLRIPIDHCLHTPDVSVVGRRIGEAVGSDHYPLIVDLVVGSGER